LFTTTAIILDYCNHTLHYLPRFQAPPSSLACSENLGMRLLHYRFWSTHDQLMINSWSTHDQLTINSWSTHDQLTINSRSTHDQLMINSRSTHDQLMINSCWLLSCL